GAPGGPGSGRHPEGASGPSVALRWGDGGPVNPGGVLAEHLAAPPAAGRTPLPQAPYPEAYLREPADSGRGEPGVHPRPAGASLDQADRGHLRPPLPGANRAAVDRLDDAPGGNLYAPSRKGGRGDMGTMARQMTGNVAKVYYRHG